MVITEIKGSHLIQMFNCTEMQVAMTEIIWLSNELVLHVNVYSDHLLPCIHYTNMNGTERVLCRSVNGKAICNLFQKMIKAQGTD